MEQLIQNMQKCQEGVTAVGKRAACLLFALLLLVSLTPAPAEAAPTVKLMFGKPNNIPDAVLGALRKKLAKVPEVKEAYFCMMKREEQEHYLFVLDIDAEPAEAKKLAESVCDSAKMFLTKFPVIAMPLNSPFGEGAKKVDGPFYTKK